MSYELPDLSVPDDQKSAAFKWRHTIRSWPGIIVDSGSALYQAPGKRRIIAGIVGIPWLESRLEAIIA